MSLSSQAAAAAAAGCPFHAMAGGASIMTRLREETMAEHEYAEKRPLEQALVAGELSRGQYIEYLAQRYVIHRDLDARVRSLACRDERLANVVPADLFQEPNLRADLRFLGAAPDSIQPRQATARLLSDMARFEAAEPRATLGVYYVFEGSKNGARFAARAIRGALKLDGDGVRYLDPHGAGQRDLWRAFKAAMDAIRFTKTECDAIVAAAKVTFRRITELDDELWLTQHSA